ncbi:MAG TPA: exosortase/archaeosortase family protein [Trebonia sp.]|jgi:exosortase/archaeosortase family protein|nr:exosortase/archaeosortase family protein [Trebonia sp.]
MSTASVAGGSADRAAAGDYSQGPARRPRLALRLAAWAAALALSGVILRKAMSVRSFEAWLAGHVVPVLTGIKAGGSLNSPIVWFAEGPHQYMGLLITSECTVDALIVPFILGTAWAIWNQAKLLRPLLALVVATGMLLAMNQFRLLVIILLTVRFGYNTGFYWGHTMLGSLITVSGVVLAFSAYILIAVRRKKSRRPRKPAQ